MGLDDFICGCFSTLIWYALVLEQKWLSEISPSRIVFKITRAKKIKKVTRADIFVPAQQVRSQKHFYNENYRSSRDI